MDLQLLWFLLLGVLLTGYAILDGFDLGVGTLHLVVAKNDHERRIVLNSIGPVWDGNEVWLVTFGGALFAAFPVAYAAAFSGFYLPFMLLLVTLISRAVSIEFRSKAHAPAWRTFWDVLFFLASATSPLLFGATVGAVIKGVPVGANREIGASWFELVTPYGLLVGAFAVSLFALHGATYLYGKTEGELQRRIVRTIWTTCGVFFALYMLTTIVTLTHVPHATANFARFPWAWAVVLVNVLAAANIPRAVHAKRPRQAFVSSALTITCLTTLFGIAQFPNLLVSSVDPAFSLTIRNAASSEKTLGIMAIIAMIGMPFVVTYTAIIYWVFRGKTKIGEHGY